VIGSNTLNSKIPLRFFTVTFLWSWFFWLAPSVLSKMRVPEINAVMSIIGHYLGIIAAFGPAIGAFISLRSTEGAGAIKKYIKSFLSLNFGWKVWASIFLVIGGSAFLAWIIPEFLGENRPPQYLQSISIFPLFFIIMVFLGGGQEEIGWRGYIVPYLENRFGLIIGSLIFGVIWAIWHIPLWFIPGTNQIYMNYFAFLLGCIGLSYFFSWVVEASGRRRLSGLVVHGAMNAFMALFPPINPGINTIQTRFWISQIMIFIVGIIVVSVRTVKNRPYIKKFSG